MDLSVKTNRQEKVHNFRNRNADSLLEDFASKFNKFIVNEKVDHNYQVREIR